MNNPVTYRALLTLVVVVALLSACGTTVAPLPPEPPPARVLHTSGYSVQTFVTYPALILHRLGNTSSTPLLNRTVFVIRWVP